MRPGKGVAAILREAGAAARSSPIASLATIVMVAGLCATVLLTTGRVVGAERAVLGTIDAEGTRTIIVRAEQGSGLSSTVLTRLASVDGIEWTAAFSSAVDAVNSRVSDGEPVPVRLAYGPQPNEWGSSHRPVLAGQTALGTPSALTRLGLADGVGSVETETEAEYVVAGRLRLPRQLDFLAPTLLVPQPRGHTGPIAIVVVVVERPQLVAPVSAALESLLAVDDPSKVTVSTSETFARLRALVQRQLGVFGRGLMLAALGGGGAVVAFILGAQVAQRRKDFGRRRALGASRRLVVSIVLLQTFLLAGCGTVLGTAVALVILALGGDPLPGPEFTLSLCVLAVAVSALAAVVPAIVASRREPVVELRVP